VAKRQRMGKTLAALRRRPEVRRAAAVARRQRLGLWIVGGALRDRALGRAVPEIDVAVSGNAERFARALERAGLGRAVFLSRGRPGPRVFRLAGPRPLDVAEVEGGSIEADLARRDFTVNAVALDTETGAILDPFSGLSDLALRRLRCVHERNLAEDPLRPLRAARFLATHGLTPDRETLRASRKVSPRLSDVAPERIAAELSKLLEGERAAPALEWAAAAGLLPGAMRRDLSPARALRVSRALRAADEPAVRRLAPSRRRRLRLALLAARLGIAPAEARSWLGHLRWTRREADEVARLLELAVSAHAVRGRREASRWMLVAGPLAEDALRLLGWRWPRQRAAARRLERLRRRPRRSVAVRGGDIIEWLRISPGPAVGEWLTRVRVAVAMGEVQNRREARAWLSEQVRSRPAPAIIGAH